MQIQTADERRRLLSIPNLTPVVLWNVPACVPHAERGIAREILRWGGG